MTKFTLDGLKGADRLSPDFKQAFEEFIPRWIESLIPHCDEARRQGADYLRLCNYKPTGASCTLYEKDGIGYCLSEHRGMRELAFNSDCRYIRCNWCECFNDMYPVGCQDFWICGIEQTVTARTGNRSIATEKIP